MTAATEKDHLAAVVAFLTSVGAHPLTLDQLKASGNQRPRFYTEVMVMQRLGDGPRRTSLPAGSTQWRIFVRAVGEKYANAQQERVNASALHGASLVVGGERFYVERSMTDDPIAEDDGWWSGASEFTY